MARANVIVAPSAAQIDDYVEQVVLLVRQSAAVQEARVDAFLDGATLAAEQVQDVRLQLLETPAQVTGWELWAELGIVFLLESNLAGALIALGARKMFTPLVRSNALFLQLPKSAVGKELVATANNIADKVIVSGTALTRKSVLSRGFAGLPGTASKDSLKLYHASIQRIVKLGSDVPISGGEFLTGVLQAVNKKRELAKGGRPPVDAVPLTDSAGVVVLSAAQDYARNTRLAIQIRHARIESFVRREASIADLAVVIDVLGWEPLGAEGAGSAAELGLVELRNKYRLLLEALIWARLYGFSAATPQIAVNDPDQPFRGIKKDLQNYWRRRFQDLADVYSATVLDETVLPGRIADALRLRKYFAAISLALQKIGLQQGELGAAVPRG